MALQRINTAYGPNPIRFNGNIQPQSNANVFLGNTSFQFSTIYASTFSGTATNANIAYYLASGTAINPSSANVTGTVTAATFSGAGTNLTGTAASLSIGGSAGSATTAGTVTTAAQPNITSVGTLTGLTVSGNIVAASGTASTTTTTGALVVVGGIGVSGTVTAATFSGAGTNLTGTAASLSIGGSAGSATTAGTVTTAAQPNITSVGTLTGLTVSGAIVPNANTTVSIGATSSRFLDVWATTFRGQAVTAQYADLAENYQADAQYEAGTVLEFGGDAEVTLAEDGTRAVAGIVSTNPAYLMNGALTGENVISLALQGRVPCKVRGKIQKGDMLVSGGNGFARPEHNPQLGSVIGKALENFDAVEGVIEVVVGRM